MIGIISSLLFLGGLAALVVVGVRRLINREGGTGDGHGVRRFFQYLLLYGLFVIVAIGLSNLLGRVFEATELAASGRSDLARGLTFTVIGIPLYLGVALWSRRRLAEDPGEARSFGWAAYVTLASLTAVVVAMFALHDVLSWAFGLEASGGRSLARLVVWGGLLGVHWLVDERVTPRGRSLFHHLAGSLIGLATAAVGLAALVATALELLIGTENVIVGGGNELLEAATTLLVGAPVWLLYWILAAFRAERSPLWVGYTLVVGVGGGLVTAIAAASTLLYDVLVWLIGSPGTDDAARHFESLPSVVAAAAVGGLVWWYHHAVLESDGPGERTEVRRLYEYLMAAVGLLAAAGGLTTVLVALVEAVTGSSGLDVGGESPINTLLAALTLLAVGGPVWAYFWRSIQAAGADVPAEEVTSPTRRVYLFVLFGVGGVAAVIALLTGVFILFEDLFEGRLGLETVRSMRFAIGVLATTGAIAAYHWAVYRSDREHAEPGLQGPRYVLLVGAADGAIAAEVSRRTGGRVQSWPRGDDQVVPWSIEEIMGVLASAPGEEVILVAGPAGLQAIPVDRG